MLKLPTIFKERLEKPAKSRIAPRHILLSTGAAAALGLAFFGLPAQTVFHAQPAFAQDLSNAPRSFADVAEKVRPAVVSIFTKGGAAELPEGQNFDLPDLPRDHPFRDFFDQFKRNMPNNGRPVPRLERAQGSGFLISADGYVVSNNHVVEKAEEITLTFESDDKYTAKVVGTDQRTDLALLKIEGDHTFDNYLKFAEVEPRVGDWVLAVGNPFGLGGTVTAGIVSAGGRSIGSGPYDFLQIDAAVNRGNSGGPSVNLNGEVVGVNTAIYSPSGGNVGIAFAIPSALAKNVVEELKQSGKVSRGWLGVTIQDVSEDIAESLGLKEDSGALITKILEDGPSANSELRIRDVVTNVNGEKIENSRDLARKVAELAPDTMADVTVLRDGKTVPLKIKLGTFPSNDQLASLDTSPGGASIDETMRALGLTLSPAADVQGAGSDGVAVTDVDPRSEAAEKGIQPGDVIVEVGGATVAQPGDVANGIQDAKAKGRKAVLMQVRTRDQSRFVALSLDKTQD